MAPQRTPTNDPVALRDPIGTARPSRTDALVERTRLDHRYASATGQVLRVRAPGGFGKSTIVSRWADHELRAVRWLDLERVDNDPLVLLNALEHCLASVAVSSDRPVRHDREFSGVRRSLAGLVRGAAPFVLVLDDVHHLDNAESIDLVMCIAEELTPESTLVLVGRSFRNWPTARLRLDPGSVEISAVDLAFDIDETARLVQSLGYDADTELVATLHRRLEGWPAGLRLAMRTSHADIGSAGWAGLDHLPDVTEYVAQEWLSAVDEEDRDLLLALACLGRFDAEMCDAILDRVDSGTALTRLADDRSTIVSLGRPEGWFRMRPVVEEFLESQLRDRDRARWRRIHIAAAVWWSAHGNPDLAIEHAGAASDFEMCERLIIEHGPAYMSTGMHTTVTRWLSQISDARLIATPDLGFLAAVVAVQSGSGDRAEQLVQLFQDAGADHRDDVVTRGRAMHAVLANCPPGESIEAAEATIHSIPAGSWRVTVRWALAVNLFLVGDDRALDVLRTAAAEADLFELVVVRANILATMAVIESIGSHDSEARLLVGQAVETVSEYRVESVATTAIVSAGAALVEARSGRHDRARGAVEHARRHLATIQNLVPWLNILARLALARACLLLDDPGQADEVVREIERLRRTRRRVAVDDRIEDLRTEVDAAGSRRDRGAPSLTDAELRVLQYLPTNLSLAEVARRLYVSRNTVKSHVAAIYRKFETTTRGETVDLATRGGLLDSGSSRA